MLFFLVFVIVYDVVGFCHQMIFFNFQVFGVKKVVSSDSRQKAIMNVISSGKTKALGLLPSDSCQKAVMTFSYLEEQILSACFC